MRVTHVITRLIVGGAQENTIATVLGMQGIDQVRSELLTGPTSGSEGSLESAFARVPDTLTIIPTLVRPVHPIHDLRAYSDLKSEFLRRRPAIVHTHSGKAGVLGRLAARAARVPTIVHTIHGPSFGPWQGAFSNWLFRAAERRAAQATTHFIAVANAMIDQYLAAGIGLPEKYTRIFSGFDLQPYLSARNDPVLRAEFGLSPDDFVIGKIARMFELKGHDDLFVAAPQIVQEFPKAKFLLVGGGPREEEFRQLASQLGLSRHFVFTGLVPPQRIASLVGIMDCLVHLSLREGLPRALPQALAAARPVVAFDCDGAREVCLDGKTGFLLKPRDTSTLSTRLIELGRNPELRERLGQNGQAMVRESFPVERMVERIYDLYLRLVREKSEASC